MSDPAPIFIAQAILVVLAFAWPRTRSIMARWVREARRIYIETPLRAITGRPRPDYLRIAALERTELGITTPLDDRMRRLSKALREASITIGDVR